MLRNKEIEYWTAFDKVVFRYVFVFVLLFINSFSFPHSLLPDPGKYTSPLFETLVKWSAKNIFRIQHQYTSKLISDSTGFYINAVNLLFLSLLIGIVWSILDKRRKNFNVLGYWFKVIICYYVTLQLFSYGFSKIFKWQFYLPEPNTLFTTLGDTSPDLLYWSTMGTSRMYSIFTGIIEIAAAILLLFKRTRLIGALISAAIMTNIILINFSFDISVKLYSCFLFLLCLLIAGDGFKRAYHFFFKDKMIPGTQWKPVFNSKKKYRLYILAKWLIITYLLVAVLSPYFKSNNFNDDAAPKPFLYGAYEVTTFIKNNDTLPPLLTDMFRWRRVFIHSKGYLITQLMNDEMQSYNLDYANAGSKLIIDKYEDITRSVLMYKRPTDSTLVLHGIINEDTLDIDLRKIHLTNLPLLQKGFHWTIDE